LDWTETSLWNLSTSAVTATAPAPVPEAVESKNSSRESVSASPLTNCRSGCSRPGIATSAYVAAFEKDSSVGA
jgi:hypothetical protein